MSTPRSKYNVLISGAGPSGIVLAWWLSHHGIRSTILERSPHLRAAGQSLDLRKDSLDIVGKMGLREAFLAQKTNEAGLIFVDEKNKTFAKVPMDAPVSLTQDIEVLRGDMVEIWYNAVKDDAKIDFMFSDRVAAVKQDAAGLEVTLKSGKVLTEFDMLVVAEGMTSQTRSLVFDDAAPVKGLGHCFAFFTIPWQPQDADWAKFYSTAGRQVLLRPHAPSGTAAHLGMALDDGQEVLKLDVNGQKQLLHQFFAHVGWETPRVLAAMDDATDFYMSETAQVKCEQWHENRVVLLGDAAHCSSPISGVGVTLSVVGAYILAGELAANQSMEEAFQKYESKMRPRVDEAQALAPGVPGLVCPRSSWGIKVFRAVVRVLLAKPVLNVLTKSASLLSPEKKADDLPIYSQAVAA